MAPEGELPVSVVVPARNAAGAIGALLSSLQSQSLGRSSFEVIVVDNGSSDRTAEIARERGARVLSLPEPNRGGARNLGAEHARGNALAFTDADCVASTGWLEGLVGGLGESELAAGPIEPILGGTPGPIERFEALWRFRQEAYVRESGWAPTGNLAISAHAFRRLGGFDPAFRVGGEDVELCLRARAAGLRIAWCPEARVGHPAERTLRGLLRRGIRHGYAAAHHARRTGNAYGVRYWRHPGPALRGDWALGRFGIDPARLDRTEHRRMLRLARAEYLARMTGSLIADVRRIR